VSAGAGSPPHAVALHLIEIVQRDDTPLHADNLLAYPAIEANDRGDLLLNRPSLVSEVRGQILVLVFRVLVNKEPGEQILQQLLVLLNVKVHELGEAAAPMRRRDRLQERSGLRAQRHARGNRPRLLREQHHDRGLEQRDDRSDRRARRWRRRARLRSMRAPAAGASRVRSCFTTTALSEVDGHVRTSGPRRSDVRTRVAVTAHKKQKPLAGPSRGFGGVPDGIRTRVSGVKSRGPGPLDDGDQTILPLRTVPVPGCK
jgi:hypothetical protein